MKILITGTDGYLGSLLAPRLSSTHEITGLDTGYYRDGWFYNPWQETHPKTLTKDIRLITHADLEGFDAIVHMAELSNDPTGELTPGITYQINHQASTRLAKTARDVGVRRFVYMSSCSVYGAAGDDFVTEESALHPQTSYAVCKTLVEVDLQKLASDNFSPTCLRNATACGASPRMRFDVVLNNLSALAATTGKIVLQSDGTPWRPLVHALDITRAVECVLAAPYDLIHNQILNVGSTEQNYRVSELAEIIAEVFVGCEVSLGQQGSDQRSYRVSCEKIHQLLPDFQCAWDARKSAVQLRDLFQQIDFNEELFRYKAFTRLKALQHLIATRQIDEEFFWRKPIQ